MWRFSFRHISSHLPSFAIPFVTRLATAPTATMLPPPCLFIIFAALRQPKNVPLTFTETISSNSLRCIHRTAAYAEICSVCNKDIYRAQIIFRL